jgi:hypothetical protein
MEPLADVPPPMTESVVAATDTENAEWQFTEPDTLEVVRHAVVVRRWLCELPGGDTPLCDGQWLQKVASFVLKTPAGRFFSARGTTHFATVGALFGRSLDVLTAHYINIQVACHLGALCEKRADAPLIGWSHADGYGRSLAVAIIKLLTQSAFREVRLQLSDDLHRDIRAIVDIRNGALVGVPGCGIDRLQASYTVLAEVLAAELGCRLVGLVKNAVSLGMPHQIAVGPLAVLLTRSTDKDRPLFNSVAKGIYLAGLEVPETPHREALYAACLDKTLKFGRNDVPVRVRSTAVLSTQYPSTVGTSQVQVVLDSPSPNSRVAVTFHSTLAHRILFSMAIMINRRCHWRSGHGILLEEHQTRMGGARLLHPEADRLIMLHAKRLASVHLFRVIHSKSKSQNSPSTFAREALRTQPKRPTSGPYGLCGADVLALMQNGRCVIVFLAICEAISLVSSRLAQPSRLRSFPGSELAHIATTQLETPFRVSPAVCACNIVGCVQPQSVVHRTLAQSASRTLADVLQHLRRPATKRAWTNMVTEMAQHRRAVVTLTLLRAMYRVLPVEPLAANLALHPRVEANTIFKFVLAKRFGTSLFHLPEELWQLIAWNLGVDFSARRTLLQLISVCTVCNKPVPRSLSPGPLDRCHVE